MEVSFSGEETLREDNVKNERNRLNFFLFYFIFDLFSFILFLELGLGLEWQDYTVTHQSYHMTHRRK